MVAGEASGDLLAGLLLAGVRQRWQGAIAHGIGGPQMAKQGFRAWWPHHKLAVHGFSWELLRRYREIVGIRAALGDRLLAAKPDVFIGVDAPDFNLDLEARLKAQGVKTVHFVCPSIWAWRPERVEKLRRSTDQVLCIFPFEPELLASHGIAATYVGHPLANVIPMEPDRAVARRGLGLSDTDEVVAILPGSRQSEIRH
ncbi:MAG: lipid-A-disaccharide synthase, partial [Betaproteobacteria bacterium]|nr:lipid-A-disaccharide synthase [Betaproteobacteria bacterium]